MKPSKSSRTSSFRIKDILHAIDKIQGMSVADFEKNELVIDGVIRNFEIIGEASTHTPESFQNVYLEIPWKQMTAMRNLLST